MNAPLSYRADEEQLLDRLVDGELAEPERRQLLLRLEAESDGWRRCALAFLEAQAWGREFRQVTREPPSEEPIRPEKSASRSWRFGSRWGAALAMAASFLLAFSLGLLWRGWEEGSRNERRGGELAVVDKPAAPVPSVASSYPDRPKWETVYLPVDEDQDGVPEQIELPVAYGPGVDQQWLAEQPGGLPKGLLEALERRGHKVQSNREFVPVRLEDGRQITVPIDQVEVQFVNRRTYQ